MTIRITTLSIAQQRLNITISITSLNAECLMLIGRVLKVMLSIEFLQLCWVSFFSSAVFTECHVFFWVSRFKKSYAECRASCSFAECLSAKRHHAKCRYVECRFAKYRYVECRLAKIPQTSIKRWRIISRNEIWINVCGHHPQQRPNVIMFLRP
jgi:hypothetical protein